MAQKPIAMEQLRQILQLQQDSVGIREMARHIGISRNSNKAPAVDKDQTPKFE